MSKYQYKVQGVDYDVDIEEVEGNVAKVSVNGIPFEVELKQAIHATHSQQHVHVEAPKPVAAQETPATTPQPAAQAGAGKPVNAPLPGTITEVKVKEGDIIKTGDVVIILEAMKMQNSIEAEVDGTVTSVLVNKGDAVMEDTTLLTIG